jgi:hypothetical protein
LTFAAQAASLALGLALLAGSSALIAALVRPRSPIAFALLTYVVAWTLVVTFTLALSPVHAVRPWTTWVWLAAALAAAAAAWRLGGRPRPPVGRLREQLALALRSPLVSVPALVVLAGGVYLVALAFATPENESDALSYHVARAAFWHQAHAVGYIPNAADARLDVNPPNAEIGQLATMLLTGSQRFVGAGQLAAAGACSLAAAGLARRAGAGVGAATWAALLVAMFPVVATQAPTAQNDLVVASFLGVSAYFVLGGSRPEHVIAGLALALAIGTKFTALLTVPVLLLVLLAGRARRRLEAAAWLLGVGAAGGSVWYLVNLVQTGHVDGGLAESSAQRPANVHVMLDTAIRFGLNSLDVSGTTRGAWWLYLAIGGGMAVAALALPAARGRRDRPRWLAGAGAFVILTPLLVSVAHPALRALVRGHVDRLLPRDANPYAGATSSWYGPVGAVCLLIGLVVAQRLVRRRRGSPLLLVLAAAPLAVGICLVLTVTWDPWRGRFFIFGYLLAAAAWTLLLRHRWLATGMTTLACLTFVLSIVSDYAKPAGLHGFEPYITASVWSQPDWRVQTVLRGGTFDALVLQSVERHVPADAALAVGVVSNAVLSPYFGPDLKRRVLLLAGDGRVAPRAQWLLAAPEVRPVGCPGEWRVVATPGEWILARREGRAPCPEPRALVARRSA